MDLKFLEIFKENIETIIIGVPNSLDLIQDPFDSEISPPCHAIEVRLDLLPGDPFSTEYKTAISCCPLPVLLTARHPEEGGSGNLDHQTRSRMIRHHLPCASAIDIELRSLPDLEDLVSEAKSSGVAVIGSFHDFEKTPDSDDLSEVVDRGIDAGVDIVKIATHLRSPADLARLINLFGDRDAGIPLAAMGMGSLGKVSRLTLAKCGSVLAYGYLGSANVEGQWSAESLASKLAEL